MKYNEYVKSKQEEKNNRKKNGNNIMVTFFKNLPKLALIVLKTCFKIIKNVLMHTWLLLKWLIDQLLEFLMLLNQLMTQKSEKSQKIVIGSILVIILVISSCFMFVKHQNNELNDTINKMSDSIETGNDNTKINTNDNNNKNTKAQKKDSSKAKKAIDNANKTDMFGTIYITDNIGSVDSGYYGKGTVRYKNNDKIKVDSCKTYGIGEFTDNPKSGLRYVKNVTDYIKSVDSEFYNKYFSNVNGPGTVTFTTGWQNASEENEKFTKLQFDYLYINYVEPTMTALEKQYKIDSDNKAMKEFVFSTAVQYGYKGTLTLFDKAGIEKGMKTKEIIEKVQDEKINSLNTYTYTDGYQYSDEDRQNIKTKIQNETEEFLKLV